MRQLLTVTERLVITQRLHPGLARVAEGALLLLPYVQLAPALPTEEEIECGALDVELRAPDHGVVRASCRVLETELPFHVRCRVLVLDGGMDVPMGTEVWLTR